MMNMMPAQLAQGLLLKEYQREIERAIDNARRTPGDKWFRRQFYRAAAQRRRQRPEPPAVNDGDRKD